VHSVVKGSEDTEADKANSGARNKVDRCSELKTANVSSVDDSSVGTSDRDRSRELDGQLEKVVSTKVHLV